MEPHTDDQIQDFIAERLAYFRTILAQKNRNHGHTHSNKRWDFCANDRDLTLRSDCIVQKSNSVAHLPTTSASYEEDVERQSVNCAAIEQCTAAVGHALEEDSSTGSKANAELTLKSKETSDSTTSASEKHSTGTLVSAVGNSAHAAKNESVEKSALADFEMPVKKNLHVTMPTNGILQQYWNGDIETVKHPGLTLNLSLSQEEYKPLPLHIKKNLDDAGQVCGVSCALQYMTEKEKGGTGLQPVEALGLDNVQGVTDVSEDLQTKSSSVVSENKIFANQDANTKIKKNIEGHQHCGATCEDAIAHFKLKSSVDQIQIHNTASILTNQSERLCNQASREGAWEDARSLLSQIDSSIALSENKVKGQAPLSESKGQEAFSVKMLNYPLYEDISDDEEMSQLAKKLPNTENEELSCPAYLEDPQYEDISEDENPQIENMSVERPLPTQVPERNYKQSPFENKGYGQGQAQMNTEIISDEELILKKRLSPKTQALDIAQHCSGLCFIETDKDCEGLLRPKCFRRRHPGWQTNLSVPCSPSSVSKDEGETDDQMDDDRIVLPISMSELTCEPEDEDQDGPDKVLLDDGETGDKERQYDTSPAYCELHLPAPKPASASSHMEVFDTVESFLHAKTAQFKNRFQVASDRSPSEHEMDSEGEPYTPQDSRESYSESEDSCETEDSCDYPSGSEHNYLTVSSQLLKKRPAPLPPETDDSVSEKECEDDEVTNLQKGQTRNLDKLGCMQKQLTGAKAGSNHIQPKTKGQKISKNDDIIILDSDTEDEGDQNCKKTANRKRLFYSGSEDGGDAPCCQQKRHSSETVDNQCGTVSEKFQKKKPSADSALSQHQPKLHDTQVKKVMQDARSAPFSTQNRPSTETVDHLCGTANKKPKRNTLPDLTETLPQSVDKEADSTLSPNPVFSQLVVRKSSQPNDCFTLLNKSRVHRQDQDEKILAPKTPTATRKKTDSCEMDTGLLYRNKKGRFVSKPKSANGPPTSTSSLSATSGKCSEARQNSASLRDLSQSGETSTSSSLPKSKQSTSSPRHFSSSKLQRSHSYSKPSTLDHPCTPTKGPSSSATIQPEARKRLFKDFWENHIPIRKDRKTSLGMEEDLRAANHNSGREARPGPSRYDRAPKKRHNSHESGTPLMKKAMIEAKEWTKAINRGTPKEQRYSVGENYKRAEKPTVAKPTKGSGR